MTDTSGLTDRTLRTMISEDVSEIKVNVAQLKERLDNKLDAIDKKLDDKLVSLEKRVEKLEGIKDRVTTLALAGIIPVAGVLTYLGKKLGIS